MADLIGRGTRHVQTRELTITGIFRCANTYPDAPRLSASGHVRVSPVITHRFTMNDAEKATTLAVRNAGSLRAVGYPVA
ncbi:hypothetical protein [Amycolatopsis orientalis]|uniref:hypothetical protein n=1 Tax=Amycolatopsis orientalis TaxID=31958 RepID=UPI001319F082|nr:hypothetical protein [Amycolatopsis orientalis]